MRVGVIGGRLQGTEAAYLAREAGFEVVLVDRDRSVPASGIADEVHVFDVLHDPARARKVLSSCAAVLPACEDRETLQWLHDHRDEWGAPLLFDLAAYDLTSSKRRSDALFAELDVPRPVPWPECGFPAVVKPSGASGSRGVRVVRDEAALKAARRTLEEGGHEVVIQEYVNGPSLSVEVVRRAGRSFVLLPTMLEFDLGYDCKRVVAPAVASSEVLDVLDREALRLAEAIDLDGIMDVEAIVDRGVPRVIEIDARLPSQTPTAVLHACGLNMVALLVRSSLEGGLPPVDREVRRAVVYEHVRSSTQSVEVVGEHVMAHARPLRLFADFYGADVALTDRRPGRTWVATLVCRGNDGAAARRKAAAVEAAIAAERTAGGGCGGPSSRGLQGAAPRERGGDVGY